MAKRFTDTDIWDKEWFMTLPVHHKLLIQLLYTKCDAAGVWTPNWALASMYIGVKVTVDDLKVLSDQVEVLNSDKIFIPGFIKFQYGKLSKDCKPHIPVYRLLEKHNIDIESIHMADCIGKTHNVSEKTRLTIFNQDGFICCYCGKVKEERNLTVDHVISRSKGGLDQPGNLVASCVPCNSKKSNFSLSEFCNREGLDFELISQRVSQRVSYRLYSSLQEKDKDKEEEKEMEKEEPATEKLSLPKGGFKPGPEFTDLVINPVQVGAAQQYLKLTKQVDAGTDTVLGLWQVFKVKKFNGTNWYNDVGDVYTNFMNSLKFEKLENMTTVNSSTQTGKLSAVVKQIEEQERLKKLA